MSSVPAKTPDRTAALAALHDDIEKKHLFPFWAVSAGGHDEVKRLMGAAPRAVPFLWSYADVIQPLLASAAKLVTTVESERRSLILVNPGLAPRRATVTTMYTAYRLNSPNEVMPPHRHSPSAIRFGLTGKQNFTGVEGEDMVFGPGDLVLTPHDTWHNHGNVGAEPAVNLSVLDLPLLENLNSVYFEHDYKEDGQKKNRQSAREPARDAVRRRGPRPQHRRRQALRLEELRHPRRAGERVVRARERVAHPAGRPLRRERRAGAACLRAAQEMGPHSRRGSRKAGL